MRTNGDETMSCAPIAAHCAPCPVNTPSTWSAAVVLGFERTPKVALDFTLSAAILASSLEVSCSIDVAPNAALIGRWLRRDRSVQARSKALGSSAVLRYVEYASICATREASDAAEKTNGVTGI